MAVYRKSRRGHSRWVLAGLVFIVAMTVTFAEVYGFSFPVKPERNLYTDNYEIVPPVDPDPSPYQSSMGTATYGGETELGHSDGPPAVPEPSSLILMSCGLGGLYLLRRRKGR